MIITQCFCDHCGEDITDKKKEHIILKRERRLIGSIATEVYLCSKCYKEFAAFFHVLPD